MPNTFSYANILHAVGRVLDRIGAKGIAIQEDEHGLCIEGLAGNSQVQICYSVADLYALLSKLESQEEEPTATPTTGLLRRFLAEHACEQAEHERELVGAAA
jgi:hypothetical protein